MQLSEGLSGGQVAIHKQDAVLGVMILTGASASFGQVPSGDLATALMLYSEGTAKRHNITDLICWGETQ